MDAVTVLVEQTQIAPHRVLGGLSATLTLLDYGRVARPPTTMPPRSSKGLQELEDGVLLGAFQFFKLLGDVAGLAAVSRDRFEKC